MTLLIAIILLVHFGFAWYWYPVAVIVYGIGTAISWANVRETHEGLRTLRDKITGPFVS